MLTFKDYVEAVFPFLCTAAMQLSVRILEDVLTPHRHRKVLAPDALVTVLQLLAEVAPLHIKVKDPCVVHQHRKRTISQRCSRLAQDLVQDDVVLLWRTQHAANIYRCISLQIYTDVYHYKYIPMYIISKYIPLYIIRV